MVVSCWFHGCTNRKKCNYVRKPDKKKEKKQNEVVDQPDKKKEKKQNEVVDQPDKKKENKQNEVVVEIGRFILDSSSNCMIMVQPPMTVYTSTVDEPKKTFQKFPVCNPGTSTVDEPKKTFHKFPVCNPGTSTVDEPKKKNHKFPACNPGTSTVDEPRKTFHRFPAKEKMRWVWAVAVNRIGPDGNIFKPPFHAALCSDHFRSSDFKKPTEDSLRVKTTLKPTAIPFNRNEKCHVTDRRIRNTPLIKAAEKELTDKPKEGEPKVPKKRVFKKERPPKIPKKRIRIRKPKEIRIKKEPDTPALLSLKRRVKTFKQKLKRRRETLLALHMEKRKNNTDEGNSDHFDLPFLQVQDKPAAFMDDSVLVKTEDTSLSNFDSYNGKNMDDSLGLRNTEHSADVPSTNGDLFQKHTITGNLGQQYTVQVTNMKDDQLNARKNPTSLELEHYTFNESLTKEKSDLHEQIKSKLKNIQDEFHSSLKLSHLADENCVKSKFDSVMGNILSDVLECLDLKFDKFERYKQIPSVSDKTKPQAVQPKAKEMSELQQIQNKNNILKDNSSTNSQPLLQGRKKKEPLSMKRLKTISLKKHLMDNDSLSKNVIEEKRLESDNPYITVIDLMIEKQNIRDEKGMESDKARLDDIDNMIKKQREFNKITEKQESVSEIKITKKQESVSEIKSSLIESKRTCVICKTDFNCTLVRFKNHMATHVVYEIDTHNIIGLDGNILIINNDLDISQESHNTLETLESVEGLTQSDNTLLIKNVAQQPDYKDTEHHNLQEIVCSQSKSCNLVPKLELQDQIITNNLSESLGNENVLRALYLSLDDFTHSCRICNLSFLSFSQLRSHKIAKHTWQKSTYDDEKLNVILRQRTTICPKCGKSYKLIKIKQHLQWHENEHQNQCEICKLYFVHKSGLQRHKKHSHSVDQQGNPVSLRDHVCEFCGKSYTMQTTLKNHVYRWHSDEKIKISCGRCKVTFSSLKEHQEHCEKEHRGINKNIGKENCNICNRSFKGISGLKLHHSMVHSRNMTLTYPQIEKKRNRLDSVNLTITVLETNKGYRFKCSQCDKVFQQRQGCQKHIALKHGNGPKPEPYAFTCQSCGKVYATKLGRDFHYKTVHLGAPLPCCKVCHKTFRSPNSLKHHMKTHSAERPYFECDICDQKFRQKWGLRQHKTIHTGGKPWPCRLCGVKFRLRGDRNTHEKRHIKRGEATHEELINTQTVTSDHPGGSTHSDDQPAVVENIEIIIMEACSSIA